MKRLFLMTVFIMSGAGVYSQTDSATTLDDVVITANRFPQKQQQTGKVLTVIPRAILEKSTGKNMGEILNQYAGLTIIGSNNNPGTNIDVYTRGAGLGNTLILVDGVPIYDVSSISSAFDLNFFTPDMVERVEILKGGQSTVYGSDAVAGVINIIPRKSARKPLQLNASAAAGSFGTYKFGAGISGAQKDFNYNLQYQFLSTEGLSSALDTVSGKSFDKDGLKQHNITAGLNGKFSEKLSWKVMGQANLYDAELDANAFGDDGDNTVDNKNYMAGAGLTYELSKSTLHANYNLNSTRRFYLDDSISIGGFSKFSTSDYKGLSHFAELYANTKISEHFSFIAGVDARFQKTEQDFLSISDFGPYENNLSGDSARINMYSAYASVFLNSGKGFFLEAGTRWNHHSLYGSNLTYTLNPSYVSGRWKFFFNLSSAFKAPTLYQLYDAYSGYPALKPERSTSYEAGIQLMALENTWQTRVVAFARKLKDGIDYSFVDYRYFNNNEATDKGIELESIFRKGKWNFTFNYTYLTGEVNTVKYVYDPNSFSYIPDGDTSYNYQFRRPKHTVNVFAGYQFTSKFFASVHTRFAGKRYEPRFMDSPIELDGYTVFDLYGEYRFSKSFKLFLDVKNLFDAEYIDINGFTTRPINFMAGVNFLID
ncbi:MAG TPA: TonB-dependent receptor [Chitinophagaceae bacterium]|nr:TonB-dependent receptor [Chitinophagaceae bacterium]